MKLKILLITLVCLCLVGGSSHADETEALITKYYSDILDRNPDLQGFEGWKTEINRMVSLGVDINEGFIALARFFFNSDEYRLQAKTNTQYVTDLYQAFFDREPDETGRDYWVELLDDGLSRNVILNYFVYSDEFKLYMAELLGADAWLPECNLVNDFYRGFHGRLPDSVGFNGWLALMWDAMSMGVQAVRHLCHQLAAGFLESQEYVFRNCSDYEFLEDLYNGILRRGALPEEFDGWLAHMRAGMTREEVLRGFIRSEEFQRRVQAILDW